MRRWLPERGNLGVSNGAEEFEGHGLNERAASQYKQRSGLVCAAWGIKGEQSQQAKYRLMVAAFLKLCEERL